MLRARERRRAAGGQEAAVHRDVGDVGAPDMVRSFDRQAPEQIGPDPVLGARRAGVRRPIDCLKPHRAHRTGGPASADPHALAAQVKCHPTGAIKRILQEQLVDPPHRRERLRALPRRLVVECSAAIKAPLRASLDGVGHDVPLPRLHPRLGAVEARQGHRSPNHGERQLRPRAQIGTRLVQKTPAPTDRGAAGAPCEGDPGPLRILRSDREWQTSRVVPLPGHPHLAEVARTPQPPPVLELGPDEQAPQTIYPAVSHDHALMAKHLERTCQVRNRVRQSRTLGPVGGGARQRPLLPGPSMRQDGVQVSRLPSACFVKSLTAFSAVSRMCESISAAA